jgi:hypothetical protein
MRLEKWPDRSRCRGLLRAALAIRGWLFPWAGHGGRRTIEAAANGPRHGTDAEFARAIVPARPRFANALLSNKVQREGNTGENQQQINQRIRGQMKGVFEDPGQQQNHSDNYEHWSFQSLPILTPAPSRRAENSDARTLRLRQAAGEILRRAGNVSSSVSLFSMLRRM